MSESIEVREVLESLARFEVHRGLTFQQAVNLRVGQVLHYAPVCKREVGPRGGVRESVERWRVNGKPRTWKRSPGRVEVPVKRGLYEYATIDESMLGQFHLEGDCPEGVL